MKPTLVRLALVFWHRSLYKVFQRRKTMQGHDIQITTTELNPSSSGFQFPLCFHRVWIWTISFHSGFFQMIQFEQKLRQFEILEMYDGIVYWGEWLTLVGHYLLLTSAKDPNHSSSGFQFPLCLELNTFVSQYMPLAFLQLSCYTCQLRSSMK